MVPAHHGWSTEQVEDDADEGVDGDFGHDAAHEGGDVAGGGGVRER